MQMCVIQGLFFFALLNTDNETISLKTSKLSQMATNFCFVLFCFSVANAFSLALIHKKLKKDERDFRFCMQICLRVALHVCTLFCLFALIYTLNITWLVVFFCRLIQLHMRTQPSWLAACRRRCHRCRAAQFR